MGQTGVTNMTKQPQRVTDPPRTRDGESPLRRKGEEMKLNKGKQMSFDPAGDEIYRVAQPEGYQVQSCVAVVMEAGAKDVSGALGPYVMDADAGILWTIPCDVVSDRVELTMPWEVRRSAAGRKIKVLFVDDRGEVFAKTKGIEVPE